MTIYNCVVVNATDERLLPDIHGDKTQIRLQPGQTWQTDQLFIVTPGIEEWIGTPNGHWTAAKYPVNSDPSNIKIYVDYSSEPPPSSAVHTIQTFPDGSVKVDGNPFPV